jgi:hypothetical protein
MSKDDSMSIVSSIGNEFQKISSAISPLVTAEYIEIILKYYATPKAFSLVSKVAIGNTIASIGERHLQICLRFLMRLHHNYL